jgi:hypothetical protein
MSGTISGRTAVAALALAAIIGTSAAVSAVMPHAKSAAPAATARGQLMAFGGRSAAQQRSGTGAKFDAALADLARRSSGIDANTSPVNLRSLNPAARFMVSHTTGKAYVAVDAVTRGDPQALKSALVKLGLQHPAVYLNDVGGWLPLQSLEAAAALAQLHSIRAALSRARVGAVTTQGDYAQGSSVLRGNTGLNGTGITVGILSDSYNCYAVYASNGLPASGNSGYASNGFKATASDDQLSGDLPASSSVNILEEAQCLDYGAPQELPAGDEGRAMMQVVHDVAPGAKLAFHTAVISEADFANGITALASAGARIIADDVGYFDEPFFQDGLLAQAVNSVNAQGVAYFSAAGNSGTNGYDNTAPSFTTHSTTPTGEMLMNFDTTGATTQTALTVNIPQLAPGEFIPIVLEWDQPYVTGAPGSGGATSQMDLCMTGSASGLVGSLQNPNDPNADQPVTTIGNNVQVCTGANSTGVDPYQILVIGYPANATGGSACPTGVGATTCSAAQNITIQVGLVGGTAPGRVKVVVEDNGAGVTYPGAITASGGTLQGHPGAAGAMAVGAAFWFQTPACGTSPAQLETFSARGGDPILFDSTGTRLVTPVIRQKPDIVGPDGGQNTFLGFVVGAGGSGNCTNTASFPNFFGTSAATPHVAAAAALLLQRTPQATPAQIYAALQNSAAPMASPSPDYLTGYGFIQAANAPAAVLTGPSVTLNLSPTSVGVGQSATLTWTVSGATSCSASGSWSGSKGPSGTLTVTPSAAGSYSYTLTCLNANGQTVTTKVLSAVTAAPVVTFNLSPTTINVGQSANLNWTVTDAASCTASGAWSGSQGLSGSLTVKPSAAGSYSYVLTCVNNNGQTADTNVLTVVTPSSGGGGGGALDLAALLALGGLAGARLRRRARA